MTLGYRRGWLQKRECPGLSGDPCSLHISDKYKLCQYHYLKAKLKDPKISPLNKEL